MLIWTHTFIRLRVVRQVPVNRMCYNATTLTEMRTSIQFRVVRRVPVNKSCYSTTGFTGTRSISLIGSLVHGEGEVHVEMVSMWCCTGVQSARGA